MNRAFLYGDGFFETFKIFEGKPVFWKQHWQRILDTTDYLKADLTFSEADLKTIIKSELEQKEAQTGRLRITFYRDGEGKYLPISNRLKYLVGFEFQNQKLFAWSELNVLIPSSVKLPAHDSGNYKLISKTLQIKAAVEAQEKGFDEAIMLNDRGEVAEGIAGNVFIIDNGKISTPELASGTLAGTIRAVLLNNFPEILERKLVSEELEKADAVFLTNSVRGIQIVRANQKGSVMLKEMIEQLNKLMISSIQDF